MRSLSRIDSPTTTIIAVNGTALAVPHSYITHKPKEGQIEKAIPSL
jgi:hypothetical protein